MLRYEFVKCMNLRQKLSEKIKGSIFVSLDEGVTSINIHGCPTVNYRINISYDIINGDIDHLADQIIFEYRKYIRERFFNE